MNASIDHVSVCICTFKRPRLLQRLLEKLAAQETGGRFGFSIAVVDNDREESAKPIVTDRSQPSAIATSYWVEPTQNIALARNKLVKHARGDFLAFIDDDEFPPEQWLATMLITCKTPGVAGVLGPVLPYFEVDPPRWLLKGGFYDRPRHATGFVLDWQEARTGNVLIRRPALDELTEAFNPEFGAGGEDQDFYRRMMERGHKFIWCDEAPVYEVVPQHRWKRRFLLNRALLRGRISLKHPKNRWSRIATSFVAVPLYAVALPFLLLLGHHLFMKYLVRLFDHAGRLLALVHLNSVKERNN